MPRRPKDLPGGKSARRAAQRQGRPVTVEPRRTFVIGAGVTGAERREILRALVAAGYRNASQGSREVLLAWVRNQESKAA